MKLTPELKDSIDDYFSKMPQKDIFEIEKSVYFASNCVNEGDMSYYIKAGDIFDAGYRLKEDQIKRKMKNLFLEIEELEARQTPSLNLYVKKRLKKELEDLLI